MPLFCYCKYMDDFLQKLKAVVLKGDRVNYRDRRGHYASGNLTCMRDQYWSWKGEPETNSSDFTGSMKMMVGNAVEKILIDSVLRNMSFMGYHFRGTQVAVGQSNPNWDGYLDALMYKQEGDTWTPFVLEIKTKSGYGADLFARNPEPSKEYMTQIGFYLKNMHDRGICSKGAFLYVLLSDNTFGTVITVNVEYDPRTMVASTTSWENIDGSRGKVEVMVDLKVAIERWNKLNAFIEKNEVPPGEYQYKYPLTWESVRDIADAKLKKIIEGAIVHGAWQPLYSRYKDKALAVDGETPKRTEEELKVAVAEYRRRHPRTKL